MHLVGKNYWSDTKSTNIKNDKLYFINIGKIFLPRDNLKDNPYTTKYLQNL